MNIELHDIHLGKAIKKRLEELEMTKTEFGRRIGVPQQHVNRIFERETMETKRLIKVCRALDFNFFALFCKFPTNVNAYLAAVSLGEGDASAIIGDTAVLTELEVTKAKLAGAEKETVRLEQHIASLESNLQDKERIIKLMDKQ